MERSGIGASEAMITLLLLAFVVLLAVGLFLVISGPNLPVNSLADLEPLARPVDLEAFKNLVDPLETAYLRQILPPAKFARLERQRHLVILNYLKDIARNSVLVMRIAEAAADSPETEIRTAAQGLAKAALECRILALQEIVRLVLVLALPIRAEKTINSYQRLSSALGRFSMIAAPRLTSRVVSAM
jgi:hypothetical protein